MRGAWVAALVLAAGCGGEDSATAPPLACRDDRPKLAGDCVGVTTAGECHDAAWTEGVSCARVLPATDDASLESAVAQAQAGDCIDLAEGSYHDIPLPSGVSLLGRGWDCVSAWIVTTNGQSTVRGLRPQGVTAVSGELTLEEVSLEDGLEDGIRLDAGVTASIRQVDVLRSARYGLVGIDHGEITIDGLYVDESEGPGIWLQCGIDPNMLGCATPPRVTMRRVRTQAVGIAGLHLSSVDTELHDAEILDTRFGPSFQAGGGLSVAYGGRLEARDVVVDGAADFGVAVLLASARLEKVAVTGALRGLFVLGPTSGNVDVVDSQLHDNLGIGIQLDGASGVLLQDVAVRDTVLVPVPVLVNGVSADSIDMSDGIQWLDGSQATLERVTVGGSTRASILIDGPVGDGSALTDVALVDGDEALGIVHQNLPPGGTTPAIAGSTPTPSETAEVVHVVE